MLLSSLVNIKTTSLRCNGIKIISHEIYKKTDKFDIDKY